MDTTLRQLLDALGEPLVEVLTAPAGLEVVIDGVAIVAPDDPPDGPDHHPARLALVIGARGAAAAPAVRAAARRGTVAVAAKTGPRDAHVLRAAAAGTPTAVLAVRPDVRWEHLQLLVGDLVDAGAQHTDDPGDLFSLAQTVALLTGGIVSIEDTASRVLAYSRSDGDGAQVDELRRLSILGWQGPPDYLRTLREWGVFDRLRAREEVVAVDEHPELGIRRRLAVGVHAGHRWLGTIWVQEGATRFADRAAEVLLGSARVAAGHLVRRRSRHAPGPRWTRDLMLGLLDGRTDARLAAATFGIDEQTRAVVAGFAVQAATGPGPAELGLTELAEVVAVHAATYRRGALTASDGARVYAVLPDARPDGPPAGPTVVTEPAAAPAEPALRAMCAEVVAMTARRTDVRIQAGIGSPVAGLAALPASRAEADRVLDIMGPRLDVAAIGDLRAEVLLNQTLRLLEASPDLHDPAVERLVRYDAAHGGDLVGSVVAYLDAMGDVRAAAERLTVHPNTLRYRVRRAVAVGGLDLDDPRARLVHHLQLLLVARAGRRTATLEPVRTDEPQRRQRT